MLRKIERNIGEYYNLSDYLKSLVIEVSFNVTTILHLISDNIVKQEFATFYCFGKISSFLKNICDTKIFIYFSGKFNADAIYQFQCKYATFIIYNYEVRISY